MVSMCRRLIFLNDGICSFLHTFYCKRKQFWNKNCLLIPPPVNTALALMNKLSIFLGEVSDWLPSWLITQR
ncbi:Uncharacterized protein HZ326_29779 [Fusarium oxysporum f. sp. albedinis]|nr:Uncharacterized protein HZ326_29779 [Fusarium oxysporum f. sp. albedinis]